MKERDPLKAIQNTSKWGAALRAAFPYTIPIFAGYWFLGLTYGILMNMSGFSFVWPMVMAALIYSGSVEFVAVKVLCYGCSPRMAPADDAFYSRRNLYLYATGADVVCLMPCHDPQQDRRCCNVPSPSQW